METVWFIAVTWCVMLGGGLSLCMALVALWQVSKPVRALWRSLSNRWYKLRKYSFAQSLLEVKTNPRFEEVFSDIAVTLQHTATSSLRLLCKYEGQEIALRFHDGKKCVYLTAQHVLKVWDLTAV